MAGRVVRVAAAGFACLAAVALQGCLAASVANTSLHLAADTVKTTVKVTAFAAGTTAKVGVGAVQLTARATGLEKPAPKKNPPSN